MQILLNSHPQKRHGYQLSLIINDLLYIVQDESKLSIYINFDIVSRFWEISNLNVDIYTNYRYRAIIKH